MQYTDGHVSGSGAELSCTHANALEAAYLGKVPAAKIPEYIEKHGGLGKLLKAYRKRNDGVEAGAQGASNQNDDPGDIAGRNKPLRIVMPKRKSENDAKVYLASENRSEYPQVFTSQLALPALSSSDAAG